MKKQTFKILKKQKKDFTFIDICAGIGGMRLAFEYLGGQCIFSSEWDKFCQKTYFANFNETPNGDITKIPIKTIPKHDILLAGFPCQPFSQAGYATRKNLGIKSGFADKNQGNIFFHIAKIISVKKPKAIFLENVQKLETHDNSRTLKTIISTLEHLGYLVNYKIINSKDVVPQKRKRLYLVATKSKSLFEFPDIPNLNPKLRNIMEKRVDKKYVLSDNLWKWLQNHAKKHAKRGNGFGFRIAGLDQAACTLSARYYKDGSEILISKKNSNPRKLTPRECARLMGFPDEFNIPVSDMQAYKQFGNSVVVPIIYYIGHKLAKKMRKETLNQEIIV